MTTLHHYVQQQQSKYDGRYSGGGHFYLFEFLPVIADLSTKSGIRQSCLTIAILGCPVHSTKKNEAVLLQSHSFFQKN